MLSEAQARESAGCLAEAIALYEAVLASAGRDGQPALSAEALRHLAAVHHKQGDAARARELCARSYSEARAIPDHVLAAGALNTLGVVEMMSGNLDRAGDVFQRALLQGGSSGSLRARVNQNLGIVANIRGRLDEARAWYQRSLDEYRREHDEYGCAVAYHNLALVSAHADRLDNAEQHLRSSRTIAERIGDLFLQGLCLVDQADIDVTRQRYENARQNAESALAIFDQLGARGAKGDAYRIIGMVYRETGQLALAESRLRSAIALAVSVGAVLTEAEATRELALTCHAMGRNQESLRLLYDAYRLFRRLDADVDLRRVGRKMAELEAAYRSVVRAWGQSIEATDRFTFGHCERVAQLAVATARALDLGDHEESTVLLGAYLHDVGMVRVPHELLQREGELNAEEARVVAMHPVWGAELLAGVEFPWDLASIVRWHHEHLDGSGYPDGLAGSAIPIGAQIVGLADFYDGLRSARPMRAAASAVDAVAAIRLHRHWWSPNVIKAFLQILVGRGDLVL